jgi:hypothetical protein
MTLPELVAHLIQRELGPDSSPEAIARAANAVLETLRREELMPSAMPAEEDTAQRILMLAGRQAAHRVQALERLGTLAEAEFTVYAQTGEDGIIEWLVSRLPGIPPSFVEFGVEDYREANTHFLLEHRNWRGLVMDGSPANMSRTMRRRNFWQFDLKAVAAFIDRDNINGLISANGFAGEIGILSVDIDGNDYWVWQAIECVQPWLVITEYNAVFGDLRPLTIPYDPTFYRVRAHPSRLYWGASVGALIQLGESKGYDFLGTNLTGQNAFFVRKDLTARVPVADRRPRPSLFREARDAKGVFLSGRTRHAAIADMPVIDLERGQMPLREAGELYSTRWLELMGEKPV